MGVYAVPDRKSFTAGKNIRKSTKKKRIEEGLSIVRSGKIILDLKNEQIKIDKYDK